MNFNLSFLNKIEKLKDKKIDILQSENNFYRGAIPWFLLCSEKKKIIYISTSNRNLENYHAMLENYYEMSEKQKDILMEKSKTGKKNSKESKNKLEDKKITDIFENISQNKEDITGINIRLLDILKNQEKFILFVNLQITLDIFFEKVKFFSFEIGKEYIFSKIVEFLVENGYENSYLIEKKGQYSRRGDILDIFPPDLENPVRLEFFGDELESIRIFDIDSQISVEKMEEIKVFGNLLSGNNYELIELIDELRAEDVTIVIENEELLDYKMEEFILLDRSREETYRKRYENLKKKSIFVQTKNFSQEQIETFKDKNRLEKLSKIEDVYIFTNNYEKKMAEFGQILTEKENNLEIEKYELFEGFIFSDTSENPDNKNRKNNFIVLTDRELDGYIYERKKKTAKAIKYKKVNQIIEGDYVIHVQYGVGIYKGIQTMEERDYLKIKYADEDILYIPVEKLDRLEKYVSNDAEPQLFRLGTRGFKRKRKKIEEDIQKFAAELIKIQARRQSQNGFVYQKDTVWQEEFEANFPFEETEDQRNAINDVKRDMESPQIMDRIVCGDVGYGKTEVAMRAAFKAIDNGKQVVMVAPTTVLAEQHFERFKRRFENYPITIENLSRLTKSKSKDILKNLKSGIIDLVIGTHRLLSDDVQFNNLGLLIIDEEQKFGVKAKEKLKSQREKLDVLTLTATPIPRTLNLAMLGIREISIIDTPPTNRLPIITEILDWDEETIKMAILRELSRDGQIFYIYNDVKNMKEKLKELKEMLPDFVKIEFINGQLPPKEIKDKLLRFENGQFDILIASTIIENGIDVGNANTILIENFTGLGLSQVYQLKGRVGRSNRQGYCYLLKTRNITKQGRQKEESMLKVEGIKSGGFQISMEDLKIRGAGEILGNKQHGTIETFGYDLYIKMLNEEIRKQKGEFVEKIENVEIILNERGFIPETYIQKDERLNIYKRFAMLETDGELNDLADEIRDRFGKIPEQMKKFILSIKLKLFAEKHKIQRILETRNHFELYFLKNSQVEQAALNERIEMKKVIKIIEAVSPKGKNKSEDVIENLVVMKVKKADFLKIIKVLKLDT
ncbi:transcription-repair coupling factor [Leptotrichia trevisanii]|uniref:transcription-repair coupling factor n=1 Tax=Leptotrichia trevisanii TaxID=109328 RepID=UPI0026F00315|nr:transcription-repair coupling factor [Leptotrichia trevisanii]